MSNATTIQTAYGTKVVARFVGKVLTYGKTFAFTLPRVNEPNGAWWVWGPKGWEPIPSNAPALVTALADEPETQY